MSAALFEAPPPDDDGGQGEEEPTRRRYRTREATMAEAAEIRDTEPEITEAGIARRLGISAAHWRKLRNQPAEQQTSTGGSGRKTTGSAKKNELIEKLQDPLAKLAMGAMFVVPTVSLVLTERAHVTARAVVNIASNNPAFLRALDKASMSADVFELMQTGLMVFIGASLDLGKLPPEHPVAVLTGVAAKYRMVHPQTEQDGPPAPTIPFAVPRPGQPIP